MSIFISYSLSCTDCGKGFSDKLNNYFFETRKEMVEEAEEIGWKCFVKVQNGSEWDFCPKCYKSHLEDQ